MVLRQSDPTSASVNEKKITNSNGDLLLHLDGTQARCWYCWCHNDWYNFHVIVTGEIFVTDAKFNGTVGIAGTLTYEDVTNIDAIGIIRINGGTITGDGSGLTDLLVVSTNTVFLRMTMM